MEKNMEQQTHTNMKEVIICIGISGSGKSTWTTNFIKENSNYLRINRDDIRKTLVGNLDGYYQRRDLNDIEKIVSNLEDDLWKRIIEDRTNLSLIIDNTNLNKNYIDKWIRWIEYYNGSHSEDESINFKFKLFDIELNDSKKRVFIREQYIPGEISIEDSISKSTHLDYITKQSEQYKQIKQWILNNYKDKII